MRNSNLGQFGGAWGSGFGDPREGKLRPDPLPRYATLRSLITFPSLTTIRLARIVKRMGLIRVGRLAPQNPFINNIVNFCDSCPLAVGGEGTRNSLEPIHFQNAVLFLDGFLGDLGRVLSAEV